MIRTGGNRYLGAIELIRAQVERRKWRSAGSDRSTMEELDAVLRAELSIYLEGENMDTLYGQVLPGDIDLIVTNDGGLIVAMCRRLTTVLTEPLR